jgi:uncharacterized membrane protein
MNVNELIDSIKYGDDRKVLSTEDIEREYKLIDIDIRREVLEGNKQDRKERKAFANKIFILLVAFLAASLLIVAFSAADCIRFHLSDSILITLLTTTSADVIGIFIFVVKYLFKAK